MKRKEFLASLAAIAVSPSLLFKKKVVNPNPTLTAVLCDAGFPNVRGIKSVRFRDKTVVSVFGKMYEVIEK